MTHAPSIARTLRVALACLAGALLALSPGFAAPAPDPTLPGLDAVLGELRRGGLVIFFRHGATEPPRDGAGEAEVDLARCATQRNLSAEGRAQATRIGSAVRALGIPVGSVKSSPFCRCKDTATLAFGRADVDTDLYFAIDASAAETARLAASLRRMLASPPAPGTNAVIVSHTANLREATGIWPKPEGVAYVFRPIPGGGFAALAKVDPQDWSAAAGKHAR